MKIPIAVLTLSLALFPSFSYAADAAQCGKWMEKFDIIPQKSWGDATQAVKDEWGESDCNTKVCKYMKEEYDVKPNESWGTLPEKLQRAWTANKCNDKVE